MSKKKTQEFFDKINNIIQFEDEMIRLRTDYANDKFALEGNFEHDKFYNYDEIVLSKVNHENKDEFSK